MKKEYDFSKGKRGAIEPAFGKTRITIRLDTEIIEWFRKQAEAQGGGNYQTVINEALKEFIRSGGQTLEIEHILREEFQKLILACGRPHQYISSETASNQNIRKDIPVFITSTAITTGKRSNYAGN